MRKTTTTFAFDIPDAWTTFVDGVQFVAQGPDGEEIILSSWAVDGPSGSDRDRLADELLDSAKRAIESAASHPGLRITKPLGRVIYGGAVLPSWSLVAETQGRDVLFAQAAVRGSAGVMLVTFESPNTGKHLSWFKDFLAGLGPPM
jgi:hypothetical protein